MDDDDKEKRMRVKPFVKYVNVQHVMPTRYNLDISEALEKAVGDTDLTDATAKSSLKAELKKKLEERYKTLGQARNEKVAHGVQYFFKKLRF